MHMCVCVCVSVCLSVSTSVCTGWRDLSWGARRGMSSLAHKSKHSPSVLQEATWSVSGGSLL